MAERFMAAVLKTADVLKRPWVRIPLSPDVTYPKFACFGVFLIQINACRGLVARMWHGPSSTGPTLRLAQVPTPYGAPLHALKQQ